MKKEAQKSPASRCFSGNCPKEPRKEREEQIKELLLTAAQRRRANKEIDFLLRRFSGKRIVDLLPAILRRCSKDALEVAIERVERRKDDLSRDDVVFFEQFKSSLKDPQ